MTQDIFDKIIRDHPELSSLPQTLTKVLEVVRRDDSTAQDLADVIIVDPALTVKLLRIVNSPYYGASRKINTVTQAVMTMGYRALAALALSTSVYDLTGKWATTLDRVKFWRHSLEVAVASRKIAEAIGYQPAEEAFIAGLLHDLGLLILESSFREKFSRIWTQYEAGEDIWSLEEDALGTNHARVGQFLLDQWNLPPAICRAVGMHHNEFVTGTTDTDFRLGQILALANSLSRFCITKGSEVHVRLFERREVLAGNLGLPLENMQEIQKNLMNETLEQARFLEIEVGSAEELLQESNRMLYRHYRSLETLLRENQEMQREINEARMKDSAMQALQTITATFNHYVNNASATILGRAQLLQHGIKVGNIKDPEGTTSNATSIIIKGVETISLVMEELKKVSSFKSIVYHDDTYILDIERKIQERLNEINDDLPVEVGQT